MCVCVCACVRARARAYVCACVRACVHVIQHVDIDVFQVCDEPHPLLIKEMLSHCVDSKLDEAYQILKSLWDKGYSSHDIITNIFRVCKNHSMPEFLKLEYIKVRT